MQKTMVSRTIRRLIQLIFSKSIKIKRIIMVKAMKKGKVMKNNELKQLNTEQKN